MQDLPSENKSISPSAGILIFSGVTVNLIIAILAVLLRNDLIIVVLLSVLLLFFVLVLFNLLLNLSALSLGKNIILPLRINRFLLGVLYGPGVAVSKILGKKEIFESSFIRLNSGLVTLKKLKFNAEEILVLLPRCIQNSECKYNVVNKMGNCVSCGKCDVKDIKETVAAAGVKAFVVTGGSQARDLVKKNRPKVIIAVACERELVSGMFDVPGCEVVGLINERPEGPCINTRTSIKQLSETIKRFLEGS